MVAAIDTIWDVVDLYNDARDCLGDSDSMACAMLPIDALAVVALFAEGPSNNVARRAAKAADVGDVAGDVARRVGINSIADNPELHDFYVDYLRKKANSPFDNDYKRYLRKVEAGEAMSNEYLDKVWSNVGGEFRQKARAKGFDVGAETHHWNYNKATYPLDLFNPENLFPTATRKQHELLHRLTSSNPNPGLFWEGPIWPHMAISTNGAWKLPKSFFTGGN